MAKGSMRRPVSLHSRRQLTELALRREREERRRDAIDVFGYIAEQRLQDEIEARLARFAEDVLAAHAQGWMNHYADRIVAEHAAVVRSDIARGCAER